MRRVFFAILLAATGCRSLSVSEPPGPAQPGTIQGTLVYAVPGKTQLVAAVDASVEILGTALSARSNTAGFFTLTGVTQTRGTLLIRFDADHDGLPDRQKTLQLAELNTGPGRDVALGEVKLGLNARLTGRVRRADLAASNTGHGGVSVFIPEGPFAGGSGDDGTFVLENLPEGSLTVAFFLAGYQPVAHSITLRASEEFLMQDVLLQQSPMAPTTSKVSGSVTLEGTTNFAGVTIAASNGAAVTSDAEGRFAFASLTRGLYAFSFIKDDYRSVALYNVLVDGDETVLPGVMLTKGTSVVPDAGGGTGGGGNGGTGGGNGGGTGGGTAGMGGGGGGGPIDAGNTDGGEPIARIVAPGSLGVDAGFTLNGSTSSGSERPFVYHWSQDAGPTVVIPNNDTALGATPMVRAPSVATVLKFTLVVTDSAQRDSPPATVVVPVGAPPVARISPAGDGGTLYASQQALLDGTASSDPNGSGIVSYDWSVVPSTVQLAIVDAGIARLTMPANVGFSQQVIASLRVTNGLGLVSTTPASVSYLLSNQMQASGWFVDAGAQVATMGNTLITLNGKATAPNEPGATFTYRWSPDHFPEDGGATQWALTDPTSPITTFVTPNIIGATQTVYFTLTATSTSGLTPAVVTGSTAVAMQDRRSPQVIATSIINGRAGQFGLGLTFDEPVNGANVTLSVPSGAAYPAVSAIDTVDGANVYVEFLTPPIATNIYNLTVSGARDFAPMANTQVGTQVFPLTIENRWSLAWEAPNTSTAATLPGLVVRKATGNPLSLFDVLVFGRNELNSVFYTPLLTDSCSAAPCLLTELAGAPQTPHGGQVQRSRRGYQGLRQLATLRTRDAANATGLQFQSTGNTWSPVAASALPPGTVFTDGAYEYSPYVEPGVGLKLARFVPATQTWDLANAELISNNTTAYPGLAANETPPVGYVTAGGDTLIALRSNSPVAVHTWRKPFNTTTWTMTPLSIGAPLDIRICNAGTGYAWVAALSSAGQARAQLFGSVNNAVTWANNATGFDCAYSDGNRLIAASTSSTLMGSADLRLTIGFGGNEYDFPGVVRNGVTTSTLNFDPTCVTDAPELQLFRSKVFVTWQEKCGSGPWKTYLRIHQ